MHDRVWLMAILSVVILMCYSGSAQNSIGVTRDGVFLLNGKPVFPIGFSEAPPVDAVTPDGRDGYAELASNGTVFSRCGAANWGPAAEAGLDHMVDRAGETGLLCAVYIPDLSSFAANNTAKAAELARVVAKYRAHPGLAF